MAILNQTRAAQIVAERAQNLRSVRPTHTAHIVHDIGGTQSENRFRWGMSVEY